MRAHLASAQGRYERSGEGDLNRSGKGERKARRGMVKGITAKEKFGYGMGEVASGVVFGLVQSVLQKYYTDILGIGVISIMMLFILARFWDAADDTIWASGYSFMKFRMLAEWSGSIWCTTR